MLYMPMLVYMIELVLDFFFYTMTMPFPIARQHMYLC